jgi:hypothetical protein
MGLLEDRVQVAPSGEEANPTLGVDPVWFRAEYHSPKFLPSKMTEGA